MRPAAAAGETAALHGAGGFFSPAAWRWHALLAAAACLWAAALLWPVLRQPGWPHNHDDLAPVVRMSALWGQWRAGNWVGVWSSFQQQAFGSPVLALYHKLHLYLSTAVLAATGGNAKAALVLPIGCGMVAGALGTAACLRTLLGSRQRMLEFTGALALPATHYATTDWLVRGALAEFTAMMLLPWVFAWCLQLIATGRWRWWIGPLAALLALAHATLALFGLVPLAWGVLLALLRWPRAWRAWLRPVVGGGAVAALVLAPFALPMAAMARFNQIDRLLFLPAFVPRHNLQPWQSFLLPGGWHWGRSGTEMTLHLEPVLLALAAVAIGGVLVRGRIAGARGWQVVFLGGVTAAMAWLQTPLASWVFDVVPGAVYLQFTWRLLAYLTVALLLCAWLGLADLHVLLRRRIPGGGPWLAAVLGGAALLAIAEPKAAWNWRAFAWHGPEEIDARIAQPEYWAFGEFLPKVAWPPAGQGYGDAPAQLQRWAAALPAQPCRITAQDGPAPVPPERAVRHWQVDCPAAGEVALPVFQAPGIEARLRSGTGWPRVPVRRTCDDPRLRVAVPAGTSLVQVRLPDWRRTAVAAVWRQPFDFRRDCGP